MNELKTFLEIYQIPHEIFSDLQEEAMSQIGYILTPIDLDVLQELEGKEGCKQFE